MNDPFYRVDERTIYPPFLEILRTVLADLAAQGHHYVATSAFRSPAEQDELFTRGRTAPGKKVTNARGYQSWHNYGIAVDFSYDLNQGKIAGKLNPSWAEIHEKRLAGAMVKAGLEAGYFWKHPDGPHIQWPGAFNMSQLEQIYRKAKSLEAVWDHLDQLLAAEAGN